MSLDFHPKKTDLFCSCDGNNEIRFWNINAANCFRVIKARPPELSYCFSPSLNSYFLIFELSNGQGASTQVRFQPRFGQMLAAASENTVSIYDYDNDRRVHLLKVTPEDNIYILLTVRMSHGLVCFLMCQGHSANVNSVCWNPSGELIASVSEDSVKLWSLNSGDCIHELSSSGNKFHSCVFHPTFPNLLVIGGYQVWSWIVSIESISGSTFTWF